MIFLGCFFRKEKEKEILKKSNNGASNASNTFQWNLIDGIINNNYEISMINVLPVGCYPKYYNDLLLKSEKWEYENKKGLEIGGINLPLIKQFIRSYKIRKLLEKADDNNILIYSSYKPFLKSIFKLDKKYKVTLIVTDLPEYYDLGKTSFIRKLIRKIYNKGLYKYLERVDKYVLLTEQMKDKLNIDSKPYIVVEGICGNDESLNNPIVRTDGKKIVFYAGTLNYKYGILNLLEAFDLIIKEYDNYELWICGIGEAQKEIEEKSKSNKWLKYYGYKSKQEVDNMQNEATVLINPRMNNEEYTKYSFPSKTIEYLKTGIPVIMYKLDGIPDEYDKYINYVDGNTVEDLKNTIIKICSKSRKELSDFGRTAQKWILKEKGQEIQAKKIVDFINKSY